MIQDRVGGAGWGMTGTFLEILIRDQLINLLLSRNGEQSRIFTRIEIRVAEDE